MSLPTVSFLHSSFHSPCSLPAMSRSRSRTVSSFIRPIGLVSPLPRFYFSQRFFFPSHPSDPPILPVQNFIFTLSRGCSRAVFLKSLFPAQHSNSLSSLSLSLSLSAALEVHQAAYVSSLPLLMTVLHRAPPLDSAIFWLALKATLFSVVVAVERLSLFPFSANSPYHQSNLTFLFSLQSTNFIKISQLYRISFLRSF